MPMLSPFPAANALPNPFLPTAFAPQLQPQGPTSYQDPQYDQWEMEASAQTGVPVEYIRAIRMNGEKTNPGMVSPSGARSAYQFIPSTRQGMMKNYKIDPWSSEQNAAMAAAHLLKENVGRTGGDWSKAVQAYHDGWGQGMSSDPSYAQRVMQGVAGAGGMQNPFDPTYYNQALGQIDQGQQAAMQPFTAQVDRPAMPQMPDVPQLATKDFSSTDEQLAKLAPVAFSDQEAQGLKRRRLLEGAAQALGGLSETTSLWNVFAKVGSAMLGGKLSADEEIQARADKHDDLMRQYEMFKFQYDDEKANQKLNEANAQASLAYDHAMKGWSTNMAQWSRDNQMQVQGGNLVVQTATPNGVKLQTIPIPSLIMPQFSQAKAQVFGSMAGAQNSANASNTALVNSAMISAATTQAGTEWAADQQGGGALGQVQATAMMAQQAVQGNLGPYVVGADHWKEIQENVLQGMNQERISPQSSDYAEIMQQRMTAALMVDLAMDENARKNLERYAPVLSGMRTLDQERTMRTKQGNTTTTVKER